MEDVFKKFSSYSAAYVLVLICLISFSLMLYAARTDSAIMDELAHIPAGYGYVHNLDYRLNPEHPPLVKALTALPLLFLNPHFPTNDQAWATDINGQWAMGNKFLYESGNDADQILQWARLGPILLTILLIILIYVWSRELLGNWWALLPAFLFGISPNVLAHGHYVTTDVGAAFGIVFATYYFLKFIQGPSRKRLVYAGLAFGVAMVAKFSTALLVPYFVFLLVVFYLAGMLRDWNQTEAGSRLSRFAKRAWRYLKSIIAVFVIGYALIVYPIYFLFTVNYPAQRQAADTEFILGSFAGGPTQPGHFCKPSRCLADINILMTKNPVTRPLAEYMLGVLMVLQRSAGGNTAYFLGNVSSAGSTWYFPVVYLLKEPLPALIMIFIALALSIAAIIKRATSRESAIKTKMLDYLELNFAEFSMIVFVVFYWAWSMKGNLNIGARHLLPTLPLIYVLTAGVWKRWTTNIQLAGGLSGLGLIWLLFKKLFSKSLKYLFLMFLLLWLALETLAATPYFLSYFNEIGGSISGGYRYVTDSNYDWGQDLLRLRDFVAAHPEINKIAVDYFGGGNPKYYLGDKEEDWWSSRGNPSQTQNDADNTQTNADKIPRESALNPRKSAIKWLAVSVNTLQGAIQPLAPGQQRNPEDEYHWLVQLRPPEPGIGSVPNPDFRVGTSIFIYKLD